MPDVPTIAELGFPDFEAVAWVGLTMPAGTPLAIREKVNAAVQEALKAPDFVEKLSALGALPKPGSVANFDAFLKSEYARWGEIVRNSGARVE
jgi:tripartite-type tricarboxylate transporter receptor subunit TctC